VALVGGEKLGKTLAAEGACASPTSHPSTSPTNSASIRFRYYLLRETALGNDGEFSLEGITARYNTDLANNLGISSRASPPWSTPSARRGPSPTRDSTLRPSAESGSVERRRSVGRISRPSARSKATWELIGATNAYLELHAPWKMEPGAALDAVMGDALEAIRLITILVSPAMPAVAEEIGSASG